VTRDLKPAKCQFLRREPKYLGHVIAEGTVRLDPQKVEVVRRYPVPRNVTEV